MDFDEIIDRRGTGCAKWDSMEPLYGVPAEGGIAMWVADMDFRPPQAVRDRLQAMIDHGVFGYPGDDTACRDAIRWWMRTRHGWEVEREAILTTHGLVNGTALCVDTFTEPGDAVVLFTPVYHAFHRVLKAAGRQITSLELALRDGRYEMDFNAWDARMTGRERMAILCSPHNPGGRVWGREELEGIAAFARRHDLILVSDEIHHDIVMPGHRHVPMARAVPDIRDRLLMLTATTKTFNIAGAHIGNVIVPDEALRRRLAARLAALGVSPNLFGLQMVEAAYSPEGAEWVDALNAYLDGNRRLFDEGVNAIPGMASMPIEGTYLAWVDFSGTGMDRAEFTARVERDARLAVSHGPTFGQGGESFLRFNIAMPRARVREAVERLQTAFSDLQ